MTADGTWLHFLLKILCVNATASSSCGDLLVRLEEIFNCGNVAFTCFKSLKLETVQLLRRKVGNVLMTSQDL